MWKFLSHTFDLFMYVLNEMQDSAWLWGHIPGLALNHNQVNSDKKLLHLLGKSLLREKYNLMLWHDVINNYLTSHRTNKFLPSSVGGLINNLEDRKDHIRALHILSKEGCPKRIRGIDKEEYFNHLDRKVFGLKIQAKVSTRDHRRVQRARPTTRARTKVFAPGFEAQGGVVRADFQKKKQQEKTLTDPAQRTGEAGSCGQTLVGRYSETTVRLPAFCDLRC